LEVSFRLTPQINEKQMDEWVNRLIKNCLTWGCEAKLSRLSKPALTPLDTDLVQGAVEIVRTLGLSAKPITKASGTECSVYREFGIDCIVFGPGVSIGNSHTANEYNILPQLDQAARFYGEAVKRFCL
jgi:acetylornithine deacetylase/succinyl-diaminopimelate desuccinylase-like protein